MGMTSTMSTIWMICASWKKSVPGVMALAISTWDTAQKDTRNA